MGFFSWKTSDTKQSICNRYSNRKTFPVYLVTPNNEYILEENYEGYGVFGGQDVFVLLAQWNAPERCTGNFDEDRWLGIRLNNRQEYIKSEAGKNDALVASLDLGYPLKFTRDPNIKYEDLEPAEHCEYQGFFYEWEE